MLFTTQVSMENFSGGKPPDRQLSLKEVDTFLLENLSTIRDLYLKSIWFII